MFEHKNEYPVILVPGFAGYGEDSLCSKVAPYFGRFSASAQNVITGMGFECHTPTFSVLSGTWDRACELYAQIVGGTVDYGAAHSQKYGHARYGKTYLTPLVPNWGTLDEKGQIIKISLIAHGFGVTVCRQFIELLYNGSNEEREATPEGSLSGLFRGGYTQIINCLVSLAGVNDGLTLFQAMQDKIPGSIKALTKAGIVAEEISLHMQFVDPYYEKHGLIVTQHGFSLRYDKSESKNPLLGFKFDEASIERYLSKNDDNIFADMSINAMKKFNNNVDTKENIYYISAAGSVTKSIMNKITLPIISAGILAPTSALISTYENYLSDKPLATPVYHENDGLVNTNSAMPSETEAATLYKDTSRCEPGIWYQMPIEKKNHLAFVGLFERPDVYRNAVYDLMKIISNFEII